jgi:hypothetical protein
MHVSHCYCGHPAWNSQTISPGMIQRIGTLNYIIIFVSATKGWFFNYVVASGMVNKKLKKKLRTEK